MLLVDRERETTVVDQSQGATVVVTVVAAAMPLGINDKGRCFHVRLGVFDLWRESIGIRLRHHHVQIAKAISLSLSLMTTNNSPSPPVYKVQVNGFL